MINQIYFQKQAVSIPVGTAFYIHSLQIVENGDKFHLEIIGSGYLYRMVRMISGALIMCAYGKIDAHVISDRLNLIQLHVPLLCAPAKGLFLEEVFY